MLNGRDIIIPSIVGLIKMISNYATKKDINDITHVDVSGFASKNNLAALKTEVEKIDADKLKTVPVC